MNPTKKFSCVIVDDEPHCIEKLKKCIANLPYLELLHTYDNPLEAIKEISASKVPIDFLLLDIDMPKLSGLELAAIVRDKVDKLIFVTGHAKYSLQAYDVLCNQYLLKPYSEQKFAEIINRLIEVPKEELPEPNKDILFIKSASNGKYLQVKCDDIISIDALEHYVVVQTTLTQYVQHNTMKDIEHALRHNNNFIRVHKSHIVAKKHIQSIHGNNIVLTNNCEISIGTTFKQSFQQFLGSNSLS